MTSIVISEHGKVEFAPEPAYPALKEGQEVSGYLIVEKLKPGGLADVYKAVHINTAEDRAIKAPLSQSWPSTLNINEIFEREAEFLSKLKHRNIVKAFTPFKYQDSTFIPMEYLPHTWYHYISWWQMEKTSVRKRINELALDLAGTLDYLHENGIVHGDVTPRNCMTAQTEDDVVLKLIDFGLADKIYEKPFFKGEKGTDGYILEASNGVVTPAIDMYAYGKTLAYIMLRMQHDFIHCRSMKTIMKRREDMVGILAENDDVDSNLVSIVNDCTHEDPIRIPSATEVIEMLAVA
jgi:serine/threonine protein kinase